MGAPRARTVHGCYSLACASGSPDSRCHVLDCGSEPLPKSARVSRLDEFDLPANFRVKNLYEPSPADRADRVRLALEHLHREQRFDRIEFGVYGGLGFRTIQAKRAGLAFENVELAVRLDDCGAWRREREQRWPTGYAEIEVDFAERFSFENADARIVPDSNLFAFVEHLGWKAAGANSGLPLSDSDLVTIGIAHYNLGEYLPETLASLAAQTYSNLEVLVIDDGSTDPRSIEAFAAMEAQYPHYQFLRQANSGIGATRNRCLALARGDFFIPVDADNLARPEMVERFVTAIRRNPDLAAMTCYFLAFEDGIGNPPTKFLHALRPTGGPHVLASIRNVYGDANAIFRTAAFREIGGYETDRGTSCEDWEAFVKLVHADKRIGVVPDHLFYYRHLAAGFSRRTNRFANHQRVLRQFTQLQEIAGGEAVALWTALLGFHVELEQWKNALKPRRHRIVDAIHGTIVRIPRRLKRALGLDTPAIHRG